MFLQVKVDKKKEKVPFGFGEIYPVDYIKEGKNGHYDIVFKDGSVASGVKQEGLFEKMDATIISSDEQIVPLDFEEIDFDAPKEKKKAVFSWTPPSKK